MAYEVKMNKRDEKEASDVRKYLQKNSGEPAINKGQDTSHDTYMRDYMNNRNA